MPFPYKLSNRLARLKRGSLVGAAAAVAAAVLLSCELPVHVADQNAPVNQLIISPHAVTLQFNEDQDFMAVGLSAAGDTTPSSVSWGVTGGTLTDLGSSRRWALRPAPTAPGRSLPAIGPTPPDGHTRPGPRN